MSGWRRAASSVPLVVILLIAVAVWPVPTAQVDPAPSVAPVHRPTKTAQPKRPAPVPQTTRRPGAQIPTRAVDGSTVDWRAVRDKSAVIAFFSPRMGDLLDCLRSFQTIHAERRLANLALVAVSIDAGSGPALRALAEQHRLEFPIVVDDGNALQAAYRPSSIPHAFFFAEGGKFAGQLPGYPEAGSPSPQAFYTNLLRRATGLEQVLLGDPSAVPWPELPAFRIPGTGLGTDSLRGTPYLLAFVAADCEKCRVQLEFFRTLHQEFQPLGLRFVVVLVTEGFEPQRFRAERQLPFEVYPDPDGSLRHTLHYRGFVPDTLLVDGEGRIRYRHTTFDDEQPPLYRMELRRILGQPNPPILKRSGPSGVRRCMICHEREYFDWNSTGHARAMRTLKAIGAANKPDCVRCHVVAWNRPGGYDADRGARAGLLEDVQCESCHGAGGPHLSGEPQGPITASTCTGCHDHKHSLNFDFARMKPLVDHSTDVFSASPEQRAAIVARREAARRALLEPDGAYAGAAACRQCHAAQAERWQDSAHAVALRRLVGAARSDGTCLRCHTTGFERRWAEGPTDAATRGAGVQCEACHGPGAAHTGAAGAAGFRETIIGLGERCPECVIRQICTGCHDRKNDPDFDLDKALRVIRPLCRPAAREPGR